MVSSPTGVITRVEFMQKGAASQGDLRTTPLALTSLGKGDVTAEGRFLPIDFCAAIELVEMRREIE